jgi:hypothetical protein
VRASWRDVRGLLANPRLREAMVLYGAVHFALGATSPQMEFLVEEVWTGSPARVEELTGALFSVMAVAAIVATPLWGRLGDRLGHGPVMRLASLLAALSLLGHGLAPVFALLFALRVAFGLFAPGASATAFGLAAAETARELHDATGKTIRLALEPEPDCYLETSAEAIAFFTRLREADPRADDFLGVCFDTCHLCLQHEDLETAYRDLLAAGIRIPKVQISAALRYDNLGQDAPASLGAYDEPVYLHQSRVYYDDFEINRYPDLGPALAANPPGDWVVHFHVPLPFTGDGALGTTADAITPAFLDLAFAHSPNLEIETYTFLVLPDPKPTMVDSISGEFAWLRERL